MVTLFISDLHLDACRPRTTAIFLNFLKNYALNAESLYILGDFFEVWLGDDAMDPHHEMVIQALADYAKTGTKLYFMHGNRDFLIGPTFAKRSGCTIISDPSIIELYDKHILLMHGDSLCTLDQKHQRFRHFVNQTWVQKLFLTFPLFLRQKIASKLRAASKRTYQQALNTQSNNDKNNINLAKFDVTQTAVIHALKTHEALCLIHGHTHKAGIHEFTIEGMPAKRIVLGDWGKQGTVLAFSPNSVVLEVIS